jgi:hypothetical protein
MLAVRGLSRITISSLTLMLLRTEFLATDQEVPGSIPGHTRFSEK